MRATCNLSSLRPAFKAAASACGNRNLNPSLGCVLVEFEDGKPAKLIGTDNAIGVTTTVGDFRSDQPGRVVLEAAKVMSILDAVPANDAKIVFDFGENDVKIKIEGGRDGKIQTSDPAIHPGFSVDADGDSCRVSGNRLVTALNRVMVATDRDNTSNLEHLKGIHFAWEDGRLRLASMNGRRISFQDIDAIGGPLENFSRIVPPEIVKLVTQNFATDEEVTISFAKNCSKVAFACGSTTVAGALMQGNFPPYKKRLAEMAPTSEFLVSSSDVYDTARFSLAFNSEESRRVILSISDGLMKIISPESLGGAGESPIAINYTGPSLEASIPGMYLTEGMKVLGDMSVDIRFSDRNSLIFFVADDFTYIMMPMGV